MSNIIDLDKYRPEEEPEKIQDDQEILQCGYCGDAAMYVTPEFSVFCSGCDCLILDDYTGILQGNCSILFGR